MGDRIHDISLILDQMPIFADLSSTDIATLAAYFRLKKWAAGQTIFLEGENSHELIFTLLGTIVIRKKDRTGQHRDIARLEGKQVLGEAAFVDRSLRSATAVAMTEVVGILMNQDMLEAISASSPMLAIKLLRKINRLLALKLRKTSREFADVLNTAARGPAASAPQVAAAAASIEVPVPPETHP